MHTNRDIETDQTMLMSTLLLLVSLAATAEHAARLPRAACLEILRFLRPAETVAQRMVIGLAQDLGVLLPSQAYAALSGSTPVHCAEADAARLAVKFRMLAVALLAVLEQSRFLCLAVAACAQFSAHACQRIDLPQRASTTLTSRRTIRARDAPRTAGSQARLRVPPFGARTRGQR